MKGYPLRIDSIDVAEEGTTVICGSEETNIQNGQLFVERKPNSIDAKFTPIFQLVGDARQETNALLVTYRERTIIHKK